MPTNKRPLNFNSTRRMPTVNDITPVLSPKVVHQNQSQRASIDLPLNATALDHTLDKSRPRRHTIEWGTGPTKKIHATTSVVTSVQPQRDMLLPPYPNQTLTRDGEVCRVPRKAYCTKPRVADDVMTEIEARAKLKRNSAVKLYAYHANQRLYNNDLLGLGKLTHFSLSRWCSPGNQSSCIII